MSTRYSHDAIVFSIWIQMRYIYRYELSNGIKARQTTVTINGERVTSGYYSYIENGQTYTVNYVADRNGYRASGAHLPVQPLRPQQQNFGYPGYPSSTPAPFGPSYSSSTFGPSYSSSTFGPSYPSSTPSPFGPSYPASTPAPFRPSYSPSTPFAPSYPSTTPIPIIPSSPYPNNGRPPPTSIYVPSSTPFNRPGMAAVVIQSIRLSIFSRFQCRREHICRHRVHHSRFTSNRIHHSPAINTRIRAQASRAIHINQTTSHRTTTTISTTTTTIKRPRQSSTRQRLHHSHPRHRCRRSHHSQHDVPASTITPESRPLQRHRSFVTCPHPPFQPFWTRMPHRRRYEIVTFHPISTRRHRVHSTIMAWPQSTSNQIRFTSHQKRITINDCRTVWRLIKTFCHRIWMWMD